MTIYGGKLPANDNRLLVDTDQAHAVEVSLYVYGKGKSVLLTMLEVDELVGQLKVWVDGESWLAKK